jgi:hypothetical protein
LARRVSAFREFLLIRLGYSMYAGHPDLVAKKALFDAAAAVWHEKRH